VIEKIKIYKIWKNDNKNEQYTIGPIKGLSTAGDCHNFHRPCGKRETFKVVNRRLPDALCLCLSSHQINELWHVSGFSACIYCIYCIRMSVCRPIFM